MVNHIHVHRAAPQPLFDYPVLAGQPITASPSPNVNAGTATGTAAGTPAGPSGTPNTSSGTAAPSTGGTSATPNSPTTTATGTTSTTTDGGLLGGLLPTHITVGSSVSTTSTGVSTSPVTTPTSVVAQTSVAAQSGSPSVVSTIFQTLNPSNSSSPAPPPSTSNPDAGPIAGGVIGGLFAVAALVMFISFLLRRRRRKQIDKEILGTDIFGGSGYRRSTILLEEPKDDIMDSDKLIPRPPSMIERRVGTPAVHGASDPPRFAGAPYGAPATYGSGGYNDANAYGAPAPAYPPQPMQRGYYPQGQQQPPYSSHNAHFQQAGYNQAYGYNQSGPQIPSRAHTPQISGHHHHQMAAQPPCPPPAHELPNPFGARSDADRSDGGHDGCVESAGAAATRERRQSGQSDYGHRPSEELPAYGFGFDETKYAELHRDSKPRPDSIDVHGAGM